MLDCHRRKGAILRTAPDEIGICRLEDVRTVYSGNFEKEAWLARSMDNYRSESALSLSLGAEQMIS